MDPELFNEKDLQELKKIKDGRIKPDAKIIELRTWLFGMDNDLDKMIINFLNQSNNTHGVCKYHLLYHLNNDLVLMIPERRLLSRLNNLSKYNIVESFIIDGITEKFYRIKKEEVI